MALPLSFKSFSLGAVFGAAAELTIHCWVHYTLPGAFFAAHLAGFLMPAFDFTGQLLMPLVSTMGLEFLFTQAPGVAATGLNALAPL